IIVNFIIMTAILVFVVLYSRIQSSASYKRQVEYFENTTVTMERVTENHLAGEQRICDVWARYIDNKGMNGEQSLAFCNSITLNDPEGANTLPAILLRVVPISALEQKWVFPQTGLENAELSMIDANGDYILKGYSFKNSGFFKFYKSYNQTDPGSADQLFEKITSTTGSVSMYNSHGQECILAYTPLSATAGWTLLALVPAKDLTVKNEDWISRRWKAES
nr:hypothetical protein [Lachnospiraceae bacterium]